MIIGGLIAAAMQTYLPTRMMLTLGSTKILAIIIMLLLAFTMSLCSEADAFIGSSLLSLFGTAPVAAFWFWSNGRYQKSIDDETIFYRTFYFIADRTDCP